MESTCGTIRADAGILTGDPCSIESSSADAGPIQGTAAESCPLPGAAADD